MSNKYRISKEQGEWAVSIRATGLIVASFASKQDAEDYRAAQVCADEQSQVLGDFSRASLLRELAAELATELAQPKETARPAATLAHTHEWSGVKRYEVHRGSAVYWVSVSEYGPYVAQRYLKRNGQHGSRRLANGALRDEVISVALAAA